MEDTGKRIHLILKLLIGPIRLSLEPPESDEAEKAKVPEEAEKQEEAEEKQDETGKKQDEMAEKQDEAAENPDETQPPVKTKPIKPPSEELYDCLNLATCSTPIKWVNALSDKIICCLSSKGSTHFSGFGHIASGE